MGKRAVLYFLLVLLAGMECGALTAFRLQLGIHAAPMVYLGVALAWTAVALLLLRSPGENAPPVQRPKHLVVPLILLSLLAWGGWLYFRKGFPRSPISLQSSDIIPLISAMGGRFVSGEKVYRELNDFGYTMFPNYLPFTWGPYLLADVFRLDYRTWAYGIFSGSVVLFALLVPVRGWRKFFLYALPFLAPLAFYKYDPAALLQTVEPMVAGYYLLLVTGLYLRQPLLLGAALLCCLLSRYAVLLLLPFLLLVPGLLRSRKEMLQAGLVCAGGILVLFVLPFLLSEPLLLKKAYAYYTTGALGEWRGQDWQQPGDLPAQLSRGYGAGIYFYRFFPGSLEARLHALQRTHLALCLIVPAAAVAMYRWRGRRWLPARWFALLLLKVYLVVFFTAIQVPYGYLFLTPLVVTFALTALLVAGNNFEK